MILYTLVPDPLRVEGVCDIKALSTAVVVRVGIDVIVPFFSVEIAIHQFLRVLNDLLF